MDQVTITLAAAAYVVGFAGGFVAGWWVVRKPCEELPYAVVRAARERRIIWHEGMNN